MAESKKLTKSERALEVFKRLKKVYPEATCSLTHYTPLQLLVATILSAQCTDVRVNVVTKVLFKKYKTAKDYACAKPEELQNEIRTCGFFRQKTKSIQKSCASLIEKFNGEVPGNMDDLLELEGVGRKTANVLLGQSFGKPAIIVDTHCKRLANRLGLTKNADPGKIEQDLKKILPDKAWTCFSHEMVFHGRSICIARAPKCSQCPVSDLCPFPKSAQGKKVAK